MIKLRNLGCVDLNYSQIITASPTCMKNLFLPMCLYKLIV